MQKPGISTAIPKQRYRYGAYTIVMLEEIESQNETEYVYLLAAIQDGCDEPEIYISCEKRDVDAAEKGAYAVRVFASRLDAEQSGAIIDQSDAWGRREAFVAYGLSGFQQMLNLDDEEPYPIL